MPVIWETEGYWEPWQRAVIECLDEWFEAMDAGTAFSRLPDPMYQRPDGKPPWTDDELDNLMSTVIDDYVERQRAWATQKRQVAYSGHSGFTRLAPMQRLALAQDLERILLAHGVVAPAREPAPAGVGSTD
jgi:hypothetical protein